MFATTVACVGMFVLVLVGWSVPLGPGFVPLSSFGPTLTHSDTSRPFHRAGIVELASRLGR